MTTTTIPQGNVTQNSGNAMHATLWAAQILLALVFGISGAMKIFSPIAELSKNMDWVTAMPALLVRFIGTKEIAGALGLILPAITRIKPILISRAATGLTIIMLLASAFHVSRSEWAMLPVTTALGALAAFVAWGRSRKAPILAR